MRYRRFGRTELQMPVITCGGMRYQHAWQDVPPAEIPAANQANLEATIRRAVAVGINHIETARGYGTSELQLGRILPQFPRQELIVQTKVAPTATGEEFRATFETSMRNLRLEHVELLAIHGINSDEHLDMALRPGGPLDVCRQLRREGRCRFIGFSTHAHLHTILRAIATDAFDYVNLHWYYVDQRNWPAVELATQHDMGVFIISPNDKGGLLYKPSAKLVELCQPLTPMGFNDLFCLSRPEVHTLSIGASRPTDFDAHLAILPQLDQAAATIAPILARLEAEKERVWGREWLARWHEGLPDWEQVPGQTNLYHTLRLYTYAKALDMVDYGRMRYNLLGNGGHWFPGLKVDALQWDGLPQAIAASPFRDRIPALLKEAHALLNADAVKRLSQSD
jgi:predicted aldo/keto reductase-like oxidoreductase